MCGIVNSLVGPVLNSTMPRHKLILHISVALCFRPSATGCWVLLKCSQFKTCFFESNIEFIFSSSGKYLYQSCPSMTVWVHSYGDTRRYEAKVILFSMQSSQGSLQRPQELCHHKTILSIEVGSLHCSCSCLSDYNCEMHVVKLGTLY